MKDDPLVDACFSMIIVVILLSFTYVSLKASAHRLQPWEVGLKVVFGRIEGVLRPGLHFVGPFVTKVVRYDMRINIVQIPDVEVFTVDRQRAWYDLVVQYQVDHPDKVYRELSDHRMATVHKVKWMVQDEAQGRTLSEVMSRGKDITNYIDHELASVRKGWGVRVESVMVNECRTDRNGEAALQESA